MKNILSKKIRQGRILNAMSLQELADKIGVSKQMISKYEAGMSMPSSKILIELAKALGVKIDYFFVSSEIELGEVNFRKKSSLSQKKIKALKEQISLRLSGYLEVEEILQIDNSFDFSKNKKKVELADDIKDLVIRLREQWEIGLDPIHNIIQLLEDKEIKVIEIDESQSNFDGLSALVNKKYPIIVVNKNFTVERKRFTLLHELGHLVLDIPHEDIKTQEQLCNRFASEFLFPSSMVIKEFGQQRKIVSKEELIEVQRKYGLSIRAIVYRLKDCKVISENSAVEFYKKLNSKPALRNEIDAERFQTPEVSNRFVQLVYRAYAQELISLSKAASLLHVNVNHVLANSVV